MSALLLGGARRTARIRRRGWHSGIAFSAKILLEIAGMLPPIKVAAGLLTTVSMTVIGLTVDVRVVAEAGVRVTAAVTLSLLVLGSISVALVRLLGVA